MWIRCCLQNNLSGFKCVLIFLSIEKTIKETFFYGFLNPVILYIYIVWQYIPAWPFPKNGISNVRKMNYVR